MGFKSQWYTKYVNLYCNRFLAMRKAKTESVNMAYTRHCSKYMAGEMTGL